MVAHSVTLVWKPSPECRRGTQGGLARAEDGAAERIHGEMLIEGDFPPIG